MSLDKDVTMELARVVEDMRETATVGHTVESRGMVFAADPMWLAKWADRIEAALSSHGVGGEAVEDACPYKAALSLPWVIGKTYTTLDIPGVRIPVSYRLEWIDRSESSLGVAAWRDIKNGTLHLQNLRDFQPPKAAATPPPQPRAEGRVLVPRVPTDAMKDAAAKHYGYSGYVALWEAMLSAAPSEGSAP